MPLSYTKLDSYLNTALHLYVKKYPVGQDVQNKPFLRARQEKAKTFVGGSSYISIPVQLTVMSAGEWYTHLDTVSYTRPTQSTNSKWLWREGHVGTTLSYTELKEHGVGVTNDNSVTTRPSAREVQIVENWAGDVLERQFGESLSRFMNNALWGDGTSDAEALAGLTSVIDDDPTTGTVGGISRATYSQWRHYKSLGIAVSPENSTLINELNKGLIQQTKRGGAPDEFYAGSDFIDGLRRELIAKGLLTQTGFNKQGDINIGVADIPFKNMIVKYDPWLDDNGKSKYGIVLDSKHVKWQPMEGEGMKVQKPERPYDQYAILKAVTVTGALTFDQLNCHGVYSIA